MFVKEKDGKPRFYTKYQTLKEVTHKINIHYPSLAKPWTDWGEPSTSLRWTSRTATTTLGSGQKTKGK